MEHKAAVVPGSMKRSVVGGIEYRISCCGVHEESCHIQQPGQYTQEELLRIRDQHLEEAAQKHANQEAALEFFKNHA